MDLNMFICIITSAKELLNLFYLVVGFLLLLGIRKYFWSDLHEKMGLGPTYIT